MYSCYRWMTNEHMENLCDTETFVIVAYATERTPGFLVQLLVQNNKEVSVQQHFISMTDRSLEDQECLYFHTRLFCNCCIFPLWITDLNICCFFSASFLTAWLYLLLFSIGPSELDLSLLADSSSLADVPTTFDEQVWKCFHVLF